MGSTFNFLLSYLLLYKYFFLFLAALASGIIVPLPLSVLTLAVGAFSSQGYFNFFVSFAVVAGGNSLGDAIGYLLVRKYGYAIIEKWKINQNRFFTQLEKYLSQSARLTIFITRFAGSLELVTNFLSGLAKVPFAKFISYATLGNSLETLAILYFGYVVGVNWQSFAGLLNTIGGIVAVAVAMFLLINVYNRLSKKPSGD